MENLYIETSQNVEIEHNIASVGERLLAHLLDYCFFLAYFFLMIFFESLLKLSGVTIAIIILLPMVFYDLFFEIVYNGQNPGKMIMKIKVVKLDGSSPEFSSYLLRWIFRIIDNLLITGSIAIITMLFNGKGQRLGDLAAGTTIIKLKRKYNLSDTILVNLPPDYKITFEEVKMLSEEDVRTIKEVLTFIRSNPNSDRSNQIGLIAKNTIEKKLGICSENNYQQFLQSIMNDYNFIYQQI